MEKVNYSIVDVVAEGKYTGNPLAVFKNAGNISDSEMQQIAKKSSFPKLLLSCLIQKMMCLQVY